MKRPPRGSWEMPLAACANQPPMYAPRISIWECDHGVIEGKAHVYLAGKIQQNCWRHDLVEGLRGHSWDDGFLEQRTFIYTGPFFVNCDHGCYHGPNSHGCGRDWWPPYQPQRHEVAQLCVAALQRSNLVFCYIESLDCYGTLVEIGQATKANLPVVVVFAPGVTDEANNQLHFACSLATDVLYDVPREQLPNLLQGAIRRYLR